MQFTGIWKWTDTIGTWILNALILQGLWIVFTLLGGVIFGFWPATLAVCAIWRKIILNEEHKLFIFKTFLNKYKTDFLKANGLGLFLTGMGLFLYLDLQIIKTHINFYPLYLAILVLSLILIGITVYFLPVFVHFDLKFKQYLKQSLLISLMRPFHTLLMFIVLFIMSYIFIYVPLLLIFMGIGFVTYPIVLIGLKSFDKFNETPRDDQDTE